MTSAMLSAACPQLRCFDATSGHSTTRREPNVAAPRQCSLARARAAQFLLRAATAALPACRLDPVARRAGPRQRRAARDVVRRQRPLRETPATRQLLFFRSRCFSSLSRSRSLAPPLLQLSLSLELSRRRRGGGCPAAARLARLRCAVRRRQPARDCGGATRGSRGDDTTHDAASAEVRSPDCGRGGRARASPSQVSAVARAVAGRGECVVRARQPHASHAHSRARSTLTRSRSRSHSHSRSRSHVHTHTSAGTRSPATRCASSSSCDVTRTCALHFTSLHFTSLHHAT